MNLYENIQRINKLISEDRKDETIKTMIDKYGLNHVVKLIGGYDTVLNILGNEYFTDDIKIKYVKDKVNDLCDNYGGGVGLAEINEPPIFYGEYEDTLKQIEYLGKNFVYVDVYKDYGDTPIGDFSVTYDALPTQVLDELFRMLLNQ
jgi:hypothetical protein